MTSPTGPSTHPLPQSLLNETVETTQDALQNLIDTLTNLQQTTLFYLNTISMRPIDPDAAQETPAAREGMDASVRAYSSAKRKVDAAMRDFDWALAEVAKVRETEVRNAGGSGGML